MAREIELTQGQKAIVDDEDYERVSEYKWSASWNGRGFSAVRAEWKNGKTKMILMSRFILDAPPEVDVDHADGDTLNNRRCNIRLATRAQNLMNSGKKLRKGKASSQYKGVCWDSDRASWMARIAPERQTINLGRFTHEWQAAVAYNRAAAVLCGPFARLNKFK